jgi:hypothetical protein
VFRPAGALNNTCPAGNAQWLLSNSRITNWGGVSSVVLDSSLGTICYGGVGDLPVTGDWNNDGTTTIGVFRPPGTEWNQSSSNNWLVRNSNDSGSPDFQFAFGIAGDEPVVGNWQGWGQGAPSLTNTAACASAPAATLVQSTVCGSTNLVSSPSSSPVAPTGYGTPGCPNEFVATFTAAATSEWSWNATASMGTLNGDIDCANTTVSMSVWAETGRGWGGGGTVTQAAVRGAGGIGCGTPTPLSVTVPETYGGVPPTEIGTVSLIAQAVTTTPNTNPIYWPVQVGLEPVGSLIPLNPPITCQ